MRRLSPVPFLSTALVAQLTAASLAVVTLQAAALPQAAPLNAEAQRLLSLQESVVEDEAAELQAPDDWATAQREGISVRGYRAAVEQAQALRAAGDPLSAPAWAGMGPSNVGGRVVDVAVDPTQQLTLYSATASGGVWKSTDGGATFARSWPSDLPGAMGALAAGSDGTLWAGTGEANPGGGSTTFPGNGVYTSKDRGATWQSAGLVDSARIGRIAVDPTDPKRVYVAATGALFEAGGQRGLYRTTDGGASWKRVLSASADRTGAVDVAVSPQDPKVLLATLWDHRRDADARFYAGEGSGVFRSTDGGDSWTRITAITAPKASDNGRMGVAFAPSDPNRAYAVVHNNAAGSYVGLWRSDDAGANWTKLTTDSQLSSSASTYGWWFGRIYVDPDDAQRLFVMGLELTESVDGGTRFLPHSQSLAGVATGAHNVLVHADQHAMAWDPKVPGRVYLGNDGGIYTSQADGRVGTWVGAVKQGATQHFTVDVSAQRPSRVVTGLQDNLCQRNYVEGDTGRPETYTKYGLCGDGLQTLVDPTDDGTIYGCAQYGGNCSRNTAGAVPQFFGTISGTRKGWLTPIVFDPTNSGTLFFGGSKVFRSTNRGDTWTAISPDLTTNPVQRDPNAGYRIYGTITTVAVAPSDTKRLYVGTDDGKVWTSATGGGTGEESWQDVTAGLPDRWVTRVAVDPDDARTVYATLSGYRQGLDNASVFRSTDAGATWSNISTDLPDAPVNDIVLAGDLLVVGSDVGVFASRDLGKNWVAVGTGLPMTVVMDLSYHAASRSLTAATFGAGIQRVVLPAAPAAAPAAAPLLLTTLR